VARSKRDDIKMYLRETVCGDVSCTEVPQMTDRKFLNQLSNNDLFMKHSVSYSLFVS
jgi:hypothetical protein